MKRKVIILGLVLSAGFSLFWANNDKGNKTLVIQEEVEENKGIKKKENQVSQIKEVRKKLKNELDERSEEKETLTQLGASIDQETAKLRIVIKNMTDAMTAHNVDEDEVNTLEEEFNLLGKELKKKVKLYQKLTWLEMKKHDPYKSELVKEWKRREAICKN